jgi:NADPH:quinone reductase-like Zn-dependent oxidoreductase
MPSGRHLSVLATALVTGGAEYPLSEIPLQGIVDRVADGTYKAKPARVFKFQEIREAHRLMESGQANGKIVIGV